MARPPGKGLSKRTTDLGILLSNKRVKQKLPQAAVAKLTGVSQATISDLELGINTGKNLDVSVVTLLAKTLKIPRETLFKLIPLSQYKTPLGKFIQKRRTVLGITKTQLAERLDLIPAAIYKAEREGKYLAEETLENWAEVLECDVESLKKFILNTVVVKGYSRSKTALGRKIRSLRVRLKISQAALGKKVGKPKQTISLIERGDRDLTNDRNLVMDIAKALNVREETLLKLVRKPR